MSGSPVIRRDYTRVFANLFDDVDLQPPQLGELSQDWVGNVYKFVKFGPAVNAVGNVLVYDLSLGTNTLVKQPTTATLNLMAGVAMGVPLTATPYGWLQIKGVNASILFEGTTDIAIGDSLKAVNAQDYVVKDAATGTVESYHNFITALVAYTPNATALKLGLINCPNYA